MHSERAGRRLCMSRRVFFGYEHRSRGEGSILCFELDEAEFDAIKSEFGSDPPILGIAD